MMQIMHIWHILHSPNALQWWWWFRPILHSIEAPLFIQQFLHLLAQNFSIFLMNINSALTESNTLRINLYKSLTLYNSWLVSDQTKPIDESKNSQKVPGHFKAQSFDMGVFGRS